MEIIVPVHQFEIRFTPILNFSNSIKEILAPFIKFSDTPPQVQRENTILETITFNANSNTLITVSWDRIILRHEGDIEKLSENNSIIEEPLFTIFNKIIYKHKKCF